MFTHNMEDVQRRTCVRRIVSAVLIMVFFSQTVSPFSTLHPLSSLAANCICTSTAVKTVEDSNRPPQLATYRKKPQSVFILTPFLHPCTCECTSVSLNSINQWLEKRPAFCRVRHRLLLSHTTRRCGRRRTSCITNTGVCLLTKITKC